MSSDHTSIDVEAMKQTARQIGQLMDDMSAFDQLASHKPVAGDFDAGKWLISIVSDRQAGLAQHATDLKSAFSNMASKLQTIAEDFASMDTDNADGLKKFDQQAETDLGNMVAQNPTGTADSSVSLAGASGQQGVPDGYTYGQTSTMPASYSPQQQATPVSYGQTTPYQAQTMPVSYGQTTPRQQNVPASYAQPQTMPANYEPATPAQPVSFDSGDNTHAADAHQTISFDSPGTGSTVTLTDGSTAHVDGGEP